MYDAKQERQTATLIKHNWLQYNNSHFTVVYPFDYANVRLNVSFVE